MKSLFKGSKSGEYGSSRDQKITGRFTATGAALSALLLFTLAACDQDSAPQASTSSPTAAPQATTTSSSESPATTSDQSYTLGTTVSFGRSGAGKRYQVSGWSGAEEIFTWTEKTTAVLAFKIPPTDGPLKLRMSLEGLTGTGLASQPVRVEANGKDIANWEVSDKQDFTAVIPADVAKASDTLTITLNIPKAATPASLGQNKDVRLLGVHCFELEISKQ